jgi:hypothetical protein
MDSQLATISAPNAIGQPVGAATVKSSDVMFQGRPAKMEQATEVLYLKTNGGNTAPSDYNGTLIPLNPISSGMEYLGSRAAQFQKYRFQKPTKFLWVPLVPTNMPGQVAIAHITDPTFDLPLTFEDIQRLPGARIYPCWAPFEVDLLASGEDALYMKPGYATASDLRLTVQGSILVAVQGIPTSGNPSVPAAGAVGRVLANYFCNLVDLNPNPSTIDDGSSYGTLTDPTSDLLLSTNSTFGGWWQQTAGSGNLVYLGPRRTYRLMYALSATPDVDVTALGTPTVSGGGYIPPVVVPLASFLSHVLVTDTNTNASVTILSVTVARGNFVSLPDLSAVGGACTWVLAIEA